MLTAPRGCHTPRNSLASPFACVAGLAGDIGHFPPGRDPGFPNPSRARAPRERGLFLESRELWGVRPHFGCARTAGNSIPYRTRDTHQAVSKDYDERRNVLSSGLPASPEWVLQESARLYRYAYHLLAGGPPHGTVSEYDPSRPAQVLPAPHLY